MNLSTQAKQEEKGREWSGEGRREQEKVKKLGGLNSKPKAHQKGWSGVKGVYARREEKKKVEWWYRKKQREGGCDA